jgi:hypothetical protein
MDRRLNRKNVHEAQDGNALQFAIRVAAAGQASHACSRTSKDKQVVLVAVAQNGNALQFTSGSLQQDKRVVLVAGQAGRACGSSTGRLSVAVCSRVVQHRMATHCTIHPSRCSRTNSHGP